MALVVKNPLANIGGIREAGSIPGLGRSLGEGNSNPLPYSCLENPMDREAWWAMVHRVTKSQTQLKQLITHTRTQPLHSQVSNLWASLVVHIIKNLPIMQETWLQSLG